MRCLIDADVLRYEIGFASEASFKYSNPDKPKEFFEQNAPSWGLCESILEERIQRIETECEAKQPSKFFFTGKSNFRFDIAKRQPYKRRSGLKPFHYDNIYLYLRTYYDCVEREGLEADDLMAIEQTLSYCSDATIICTRDKDLRQVSGWQYGWECGKQPSFGPSKIDSFGSIVLSEDRSEVKGWGLKFFLAQLITGDSVDTVPGLPGRGVVYAYDLLKDSECYEEGLSWVLDAYKQKYGETAEAELTEQAHLLWMIRELNEDGSPVMWDIKEIYAP